jgi:hypothetical protein
LAGSVVIEATVVERFDIRCKGGSVIFEFGEGDCRIVLAMKGRTAVSFIDLLGSRFMESPRLMALFDDRP